MRNEQYLLSVYSQIRTNNRTKSRIKSQYTIELSIELLVFVNIFSQVLRDNFCDAVNHKKSNIMNENLNKLLMMTGQNFLHKDISTM